MRWFIGLLAVAAIAMSGARPDLSRSITIVKVANGRGTGFVLEVPHLPAPIMITNQHVCESYKQVRITWSDGAITTEEVIRTDAALDLCAITATHNAPTLKLADTPARVNEAVYTEGYPAYRYRASSGVVLQYRNIYIQGQKYFSMETTMHTSPGASGSPVVNSKGEVVGVVQTSGNFGFNGSVTLKNLRRFLDAKY